MIYGNFDDLEDMEGRDRGDGWGRGIGRFFQEIISTGFADGSEVCRFRLGR